MADVKKIFTAPAGEEIKDVITYPFSNKKALVIVTNKSVYSITKESLPVNTVEEIPTTDTGK